MILGHSIMGLVATQLGCKCQNMGLEPEVDINDLTIYKYGFTYQVHTFDYK